MYVCRKVCIKARQNDIMFFDSLYLESGMYIKFVKFVIVNIAQ